MEKENKKVKNATISGIYRSKLEARFAKELTILGIGFKYEPFKITLIEPFEYKNQKYRAMTYTPDFMLEDGTIIEAKGFRTDAYNVKRKLILKFCKENNIDFYEIRSLKELRNLVYEKKNSKN